MGHKPAREADASEPAGELEWPLLERAFERGYFDTPRRTSLVELGAEFGYDRQEVCREFRRQLRACLAGEFG
jgi:hypothetical protein